MYGGPTAPLPKRVTLRTLQSKYRKKQPISMVTAYDYPSAVHVSNLSHSDQIIACNAALHGLDPYMVLSSCLRAVSVHCCFLARVTPSDIRLYQGCRTNLMQLIHASMPGHQCVVADSVNSVIQVAGQDLACLTLQKDLEACCNL